MLLIVPCKFPRLVRGFFFTGLLFLLPLHAVAAPYKPANDADILERLPDGLRTDALRASQRALQQQSNPTIAATLARGYIERARRESDPRLLGYAEGLLKPWWTSADAPAEIILLRITIQQARHEFNAALSDLDSLLVRKPDSAQGWLTRAIVLRVTGRFTEAAASCSRLKGLADPFIAALCSASVASLNGQLQKSYNEILALRQSAPSQPLDIKAWLFAELGDMAERLGDTAAAEAHYQQGLKQAPEDHGLRAAYADLLLDSGRASEVIALVSEYPSVDALKLRHALAFKALNDPGFAALDAQMREGYAAAHLRDEDLHLREEARYTLQAQGDAPRALALAQANWTIQHEPWDARLLLMAAYAAKQPQAAQPVLDWLQVSRLQDARLAPLMKVAP